MVRVLTFISSLSQGSNLFRSLFISFVAVCLTSCSGDGGGIGVLAEGASDRIDRSSPATAFVSVWNVSAGDTVTLPLPSGYDYDFEVYWGKDEERSTITSHNDPDRTYTYKTSGKKTVAIVGTLPSWDFSLNPADAGKIEAVTNLGDVGWRNLASAFQGCWNLKTFRGGNVSGVDDMSNMFRSSPRVNPDMSGWDTSSVTDMSGMFKDAGAANPDMSTLDLSSVQHMSSFSDGSGLSSANYSGLLLHLAATNTNSGVTLEVGSVGYEPRAANARQTLVSRGWNISDGGAGSDSGDSGDSGGASPATAFVSVWNVSAGDSIRLPLPSGYGYDFKVYWEKGGEVDTITSHNDPDRTYTYATAGKKKVAIVGTLPAWDFSLNPADAGKLEEVINLGDVGWRNLANAFKGCRNLKAVRGGDVSLVADMSNMFHSSPAVKPDMSGWDTSGVIDMRGMLNGASAADPDMSALNLSSVRYMGGAFDGSGLSSANYSGLLLRLAANNNHPNVALGAGDTKYEPRAASARQALVGRGWSINDGGVLVESDNSNTSPATAFVSVWNVDANDSITLPLPSGYGYDFEVHWGDRDKQISRVTAHNDANRTFTYKTTGKKTIAIVGTLPAWDSSLNPSDADKLEQVINLGDVGWRNLANAFRGCGNLTTFRGGNVSLVADMNNMFRDSPTVKPDLSGWDTSSLMDMREMFKGASAADPDMSALNLSSVRYMGSAFDGSGLSSTNYSELLLRLAATNAKASVALGAGSVKYESRAESARQTLVSRGWTIRDGGVVVVESDSGDDGSDNRDISPATAFVSVWDISAGDSITLPLPPGHTYDFEVYWGENDERSTVTSHNDPGITYTYKTTGPKTVAIVGTMPAWDFSLNPADADKLEAVTSLGDVGWKKLANAFRGCGSLTTVRGGNVSGVANMSNMFRGSPTVRPDLSGWDTSSVTNMSGMFKDASAADPDMSALNLSSVDNMGDAFDGSGLSSANYSALLLRLAANNTKSSVALGAGSVKYESRAESARQTLVGRGWSISDGGVVVVESDSGDDGSDNRDISPATAFVSVWDISAGDSITLPLPSGYTYDFEVYWGENGERGTVTSHNDTDITYTYKTTGPKTVAILGTLPAWDFSLNPSDAGKLEQVTDLGDVGWKNLANAFRGCSNLTTFRGGNVSGVANMSNMFRGSPTVRPDLSGWDTSSVTNMSGMFKDASAADPDMSALNLSSVDNMGDVFDGSGLSSANYSALLLRLAANNTNSSVVLGAGSVKYEPRAESARQTLVGRGWSISDGGVVVVESDSGDDGSDGSDNRDISPATAFVSVWNVSAGDSITLPLPPGHTYDFEVYWGEDGQGGNEERSTVTSHNDPGSTYRYKTSGKKTIAILGTLPAWDFTLNPSDAGKLEQVTDLGDVGWKKLANAFRGCSNLTTFRGGNVSGVANMSNMFRGSSTVRPDLSGWDTSSVTNMSGMFKDARAADPDMSALNLSSVDNMGGAFDGSGLSSANYSKLLLRLAANNTKSSVALGASNIKYEPRAESARQTLVGRGWSISDGGVIVESDSGDDGRDNSDTSSGTPFVSVWNISAGDSITLPLPSGHTYDFRVYWGDGQVDRITSHNDSKRTHRYDTTKKRTITIVGTLPAWDFSRNPADADKLEEVTNLGDVGWKNLANAFRGCDNLTTFRGGNVSAVTNMSNMFRDSPLVTPDISGWDTSSVTNMSGMFKGAAAIDPDMSALDLSSVQNMDSAFDGSYLSNLNYSELLLRLAANNNHSNVALGARGIKYEPRVASARQTLVGRGWNINDGGVVEVSSSYPVCPTNKDHIVVCGASGGGSNTLTEIMSDNPTGRFKVYLSEPLKGARDQIIVALRAQLKAPGSGTLTLPGTATEGQDYSFTVLTPGVTLKENLAFDEYELTLSNAVSEVEFEITTIDDSGPPGTSPAERNEDGDETVSFNVTYVAGISRANDSRVRNASVSTSINSSTFSITTGHPASLAPLVSIPKTGTCELNYNKTSVIWDGARFLGEEGCDSPLTRGREGGGDKEMRIPTTFDSRDRFYWRSAHIGSVSNSRGRIVRASSYSRFSRPSVENYFAMVTIGGTGDGATNFDFAIDQSDRVWVYTHKRGDRPSGKEFQLVHPMPENRHYGTKDMRCRLYMQNPQMSQAFAFGPSPQGPLAYFLTKRIFSVKNGNNGTWIRAYTMDSLLGEDGVCQENEDGRGIRSEPPSTPVMSFSSSQTIRRFGSLAVDSMQRIYNIFDHGFQIYDRDSADPTALVKVFEINDQGKGEHQFNWPVVVALDSADRIYVLDTANHRIRIFEACAADMSNCTGSNRPALLATIDGTKAFGKVDGATLTPAQQQYSALGGLRFPVGMSIDSTGRIWVVSVHGLRKTLEWTFYRLQVFAPYRP